MGSSTNQSAVSEKDKSYISSKKKFRENALAMDYTEEEEGKDKIENNVSKMSKELKKRK